MATTSTLLEKLQRTQLEAKRIKDQLAEAKCNLDYDVVRGFLYPGVKGRGPSAETSVDCYGSPECYDVTIEIRGYCPVDFLYDGYPDNAKAVSEQDRAISAAKTVFTDIAPIAEICNDPSFDVSGPHHFAYHCKGDKLFFSCTYEGYEIC
jgi:hypothetical protein